MLRIRPYRSVAGQPGLAASPFASARHWNHRVGALIGLWVERGRTRRALTFLDDRQLMDLGLARADQWREGSKPFWRP